MVTKVSWTSRWESQPVAAHGVAHGRRRDKVVERGRTGLSSGTVGCLVVVGVTDECDLSVVTSSSPGSVAE